ncbi:MAG: cadmium-containing carbonic anhydrase [Candidatus Saccharibacteria bacterium]
MAENFNDIRGEIMPDVEIVKLADGLGMTYLIPDVNTPGISADVQEQKAGNEDLQALTDEAIHSANILVAVDKDDEGDMLDDDGCGDGRSVALIFTRAGKTFKRSLNRPKVFGGGAIMTAATRIGLGNAGNSLNETIDDSIDQLADREVNFGAHTDNHAHGENCGCGAIDKAPLIMQAAAHFRGEIAATIAFLGVDTEGLDEVQNSYANYADRVEGQPYSGRQVMDMIIDNGKIVKELADGHLETRVLLNMVEGYTVDQERVREATDGRAQVFAVDVWRLKQIAEKLYDDPAEQQRAFLSELVYTLATAAVLTKGDLPVYAIQHANQPAMAV